MLDKGKTLSRAPWGELSPGWVVARSGAIGGLLVANYYVWKVRVWGPINAAFFVRAPKSLVDAGYRLVISDGADTRPFTRGGLAPTLPNPIPVGLIASNDTAGTTMASQMQEPDSHGDCSSFNWGSPPPPEFETYHWIWSSCVLGLAEATGWKVSNDEVFSADFDPTNIDGSPTPIYTTNGNALTPQEAVQRVRDLLSSDDPDYAVLDDWACAVLGGSCQNPKDAYPTTPSCAGTTAAICEQRFRDAGFVGDIQTEELSADQAVMELDAGKVTATYPHEGIQIAAPRLIKIYVNPDPMPAMTSQMRSIADTLAQNNPDTVTETNKATIAKTCVEDLARASRPASECRHCRSWWPATTRRRPRATPSKASCATRPGSSSTPGSPRA